MILVLYECHFIIEVVRNSSRAVPLICNNIFLFSSNSSTKRQQNLNNVYQKKKCTCGNWNYQVHQELGNMTSGQTTVFRKLSFSKLVCSVTYRCTRCFGDGGGTCGRVCWILNPRQVEKSRQKLGLCATMSRLRPGN